MMGAMEVFSLVGKLAIDAKGADSVIDNVKSKVESLGTTIEKTGTKISGVGGKLTKTVTLAGTAFSGFAIKTAADFESAMAEVSAISGATGDDFKLLEEKAKEMGKTTKFSASESAEAMKYMAMAGWKTEDMLDGLAGIMDLAAASGEDLGTTSDIVTDALTAFGLKASDSGHFADILAAASSNANTNVRMMGETFKYVAPVAGALGYSAEDTALAIGLMGNAGIKSSQAGTSLRSILSNLQGEVKFTGAGFGELAVQTTNADGSMRDLNSILDDCRSAFSMMTESERAANAETVVGREAMSAFLALMTAAPEDINKVSAAINNCDGVSKQMADTMNNTLSGQITLLKSNLEGLAIQFVSLIMPYLKEGVEWLSNIVTWLSNLDEGTQRMIIKLAALAIAAGPVLKVTGNLVSGIGNIIKIGGQVGPMISKIIPAGKSLIGGMGNLMQAGGKLITGIGSKLLPALAQFGPQGAVIALVVAGVAFLGYEIYKHWDEISEFLTKAWDGIKAAASKVVDFFKDNWQGIALFIVNPIAGGLKLAYDNCEGFRDFINGWGEKIKSGWESLTTSISEGISRFGENAKQKFSDMKENVVGRMEEMKEKGVAKFEELKTKATDKIEELKEKASEKISNMQNAVSEKFTKLKEDAVEKVHTLKENAVQGFEDMRENVSNKVHELTTAASEKFEELKTTASEKITALKEENARKFQELKDGAVEQIGNLRDRAVEGFHDLKEKAAGSIETLKSEATAKIADIATAAGEKFKAVGSGLLDMFGSVREKLGNIVETVKGFFNFNWKFPDIKLPHFSVSWDNSGILGQAAEALGLQGIPKISVQWYKDGGVMMKPTAFAFNPMTGSIKAGGEAGPEAIAPVTVLQDYIRSAVSESNGELAAVLLNIYNLLLRYLPELSEMQMVLDTGETVGALALPMNDVLGKIAARRERIK